MLERLNELEAEALRELEAVQNEAALKSWKVRYLGRSAELNEIMKNIGQLSKQERPKVGRRGNEVKVSLENAHEERLEALQEQAILRSLEIDQLDVTLPGRPVSRGRLHPANQTLRQILDIWKGMGFQVYLSREVETEAYNFELLNIPAHHPARDLWDTFYTEQEDVLLRTHTSPGQIHVMRELAPNPIRVVLPGMCYRYEPLSARAEIQFNQVEGLAVGRHITFADLKGTLTAFARRFFDTSVATRFRAAHFPFTEPSAEMDIECFVCLGQGCSVCKQTGWLEILGCGMVHPIVLENGGYDPLEFSGYAFGMGPERIAMLKHRIDDIRSFWRNDLRFLEQF
jgi:phenylalanyl-tRNA synthetase alpha chain